MREPSFPNIPWSVLRAALAVISVGAVVSGCASRSQPVAVTPPGLIDRLTPYKVLIQQGNVVTKEQVAVVQPGMVRDQVRDILGSPMLTDVFHAQRWDYPYAVQRRGEKVDKTWVVTVVFDGDKVQKVIAPELPTEYEFVARMGDTSVKPRVAPLSLELTPEQRSKLKPPIRTETQAPANPQGASRSYPPLESR
jgi:outer membrane protein assembly factor BamE